MIVANYNSPTEKFCIEEDGNSWTEIKEGCEVFDKTIELSCDYSIVSEFRFDGEYKDLISGDIYKKTIKLNPYELRIVRSM